MKTKARKANVKGTATTVPAPDQPSSASLPPSASETSGAASEPGRSNVPFECSKPTPMELIAAARHLIGNGKFPKSEDARDLLLRDALRIWHHALALVGDFDAAGNPAIEMNLHERQEHREKWVNRSGPPMIGDETIKYITNGDRDKRAIPKLEGWLKSGNVPWGVNTLDKLKAPLDRGAVEFLRHCFLKHEADRISAQNAVKGQLAAEMAATKKLRIATEKKASEKRPR